MVWDEADIIIIGIKCAVKVMHLEVKVLIVQLCLTICNSMHCSPQGSSVHGILRARILEWIAILFSKGSNPGLLHYRQILYHLSHQESPWIIPKPSCSQSIENWPSAKPVPGAKKYCCHRRSGGSNGSPLCHWLSIVLYTSPVHLKSWVSEMGRTSVYNRGNLGIL